MWEKCRDLNKKIINGKSIKCLSVLPITKITLTRTSEIMDVFLFFLIMFGSLPAKGKVEKQKQRNLMIIRGMIRGRRNEIEWLRDLGGHM